MQCYFLNVESYYAVLDWLLEQEDDNNKKAAAGCHRCVPNCICTYLGKAIEAVSASIGPMIWWNTLPRRSTRARDAAAITPFFRVAHIGSMKRRQ